MNKSEETEEIKTFPLYPYLLQGQQALPNCKQISAGHTGDLRYTTPLPHQTTLLTCQKLGEILLSVSFQKPLSCRCFLSWSTERVPLLEHLLLSLFSTDFIQTCTCTCDVLMDKLTISGKS